MRTENTQIGWVRATGGDDRAEGHTKFTVSPVFFVMRGTRHGNGAAKTGAEVQNKFTLTHVFRALLHALTSPSVLRQRAKFKISSH